MWQENNLCISVQIRGKTGCGFVSDVYRFTLDSMEGFGEDFWECGVGENSIADF